MKICVFSIVHWDTQEESERLKVILNKWSQRINKFLAPSYNFLSLGTSSNLDHKPLNNIPYIDSKFERQNRLKRINYWKCGLLSGIYYALINKEKIGWDYLIYNHYCVLLGENLIPYIKEFSNTHYQICAPQELTIHGSLLETGLMIMKPDGAKEWLLNSSMSDAIVDNAPLPVELEATILFKNKWYNPFNNITTIKRFHDNINNDSSDFDKNFVISSKEFENTPFVFTADKHCTRDDLRRWEKKHPVN